MIFTFEKVVVPNQNFDLAAKTRKKSKIFWVGTAEEGAAFRRVAGRAKLVRYGTDCYAYALIAAGQIDLVIEAGLQAYDVQAPIAVIEAAGGIVTDWQGRPAPQGGQILAAANRDIHAEALALLNA